MYHMPLFFKIHDCDLVSVHAFEQSSNYINYTHTPFKKTSLTTIKFNKICLDKLQEMEANIFFKVSLKNVKLDFEIQTYNFLVSSVGPLGIMSSKEL